jgi:oxalate decarboxylase
MHWHPNADEWQYYISGEATMTIFNTGPRAVTQNFKPGDISYVEKSLGHYILNTGNTDLVFLEIFRSDRFEDISLSDWLRAHAARLGRAAPQHRPRRRRALSEHQPGDHAAISHLFCRPAR